MTVTHGFELVREQMIPELNTVGRLYRHQRTGARLLSLENDDENKVFGITFATPPDDSTGLPHIMEHSVLCGSRKYPVKEPFVELLKGSLQTFLNAFTYPDKTCYPFASQNVQDFYNLLDVYLDAVFYPKLTPYTLQQEGWHYELEEPGAPLVYKGVVFNEMKGAYSDPDNLLERTIQQTLFPDTTYGVDSGGDPSVIPDLTYEQFKRFHDTYYHPSNSFIFFYGDDDPVERLRRIDEFLAGFDALDVNATVALQPRWDSPRRVTTYYAAGPDDVNERKGMLTVNWMLDEMNDPALHLAFDILEYILIGTSASPLRKALIDSGLGEDLAGSGYEADLRQSFFSTGLKGIDVEQAGQVEALILETLTELVEQGIEPEMIEAAMNTLEFALRENNTGSFPRGIALMIRALRLWLHGGDPMAALAFEGPLAAVKAALESDPRYFEGLIRKYLLENPHRTTLTLAPDGELQQRQEAREKARLAEAQAAMSAEDLEQVLEDTRTLKQMQETPDSPEALATIPSLSLSDIDREIKRIPLDVQQVAGTQLLYHDLFTNGIIYLDLGLNLAALPQDLLPYAGLFGQVLLEIGTEKEDYIRLAQRIGRKTGGIGSSLMASMVRDAESSAAWMFLRGKATMQQATDLLSILLDVLLTVKLDNKERFRQIVLEEKASLEAGIVSRGHAVVRTRLQAALNEADWVSEQTGGLDYLFFLRRLVDEIESDWPGVLNKLEAIRHGLINRQAMIANVTLDAANWQVFRPQLVAFLNALPAFTFASQAWEPARIPVNEGLIIPAQVNYVGKAADLFKLGYKLHGSFLVILNYLQATWLWEQVRVKGGAYGGFATFDSRSGAFSYLSYRDPNVRTTLNVYDETAEFLRRLELTPEELTKSIIGAIGTLDQYQLPDAKGVTSMARYLTGETDDKRQKMRDEVLSTTQDHFRQFAEVLTTFNREAAVAVLGAEDALENADLELRLTRVL